MDDLERAFPETGARLHPLNRGFTWRDAPREGLKRLTPAEASRFNAEGFFVLRGAFTADDIAAVRAEIDPFEAAHAAYAKARGGKVRLTDAEAITFTLHLVRKSAALRAFSAHPVIRDVCHDLIGPAVRLYWDQAVYKKTEKAQEFPWHQDNGYSFVEPQQYLTFWLPLVDVDVANGCPWILPGLHRMGTLEHLADGDRAGMPGARAGGRRGAGQRRGRGGFLLPGAAPDGARTRARRCARPTSCSTPRTARWCAWPTAASCVRTTRSGST